MALAAGSAARGAVAPGRRRVQVVAALLRSRLCHRARGSAAGGSGQRDDRRQPDSAREASARRPVHPLGDARHRRLPGDVRSGRSRSRPPGAGRAKASRSPSRLLAVRDRHDAGRGAPGARAHRRRGSLLRLRARLQGARYAARRHARDSRAASRDPGRGGRVLRAGRADQAAHSEARHREPRASLRPLSERRGSAPPVRGRRRVRAALPLGHAERRDPGGLCGRVPGDHHARGRASGIRVRGAKRLHRAAPRSGSACRRRRRLLRSGRTGGFCLRRARPGRALQLGRARRRRARPHRRRARAPRQDGGMSARTAWSEGRLAGLFGIAILFVYLATAGGRIVASDEHTMFLLTQALVERHSVSVPEGNAEAGPDGKLYPKAGIGQALAAAPFYVVGKAVAPAFPERLRAFVVRGTTSLVNPVAGAALAALLLLLLLELRLAPREATVLALVAALATPLWVYAKLFLGETLIALGLAIELYGVLRLRRGGGMGAAALAAWGAGAALLVKYAVLPAAVALFVPAVPTLRRRLPPALAALVVLGACGAVAAAYDLARTGNLLGTGYGRQR